MSHAITQYNGSAPVAEILMGVPDLDAGLPFGTPIPYAWTADQRLTAWFTSEMKTIVIRNAFDGDEVEVALTAEVLESLRATVHPHVVSLHKGALNYVASVNEAALEIALSAAEEVADGANLEDLVFEVAPASDVSELEDQLVQAFRTFLAVNGEEPEESSAALYGFPDLIVA